LEGEDVSEKDLYAKKRFKNYSTATLLARINRLFAAGDNDDDEVYELFRRSREQGFEVVPKYNTYEVKM
jgi:hypothetical protein